MQAGECHHLLVASALGLGRDGLVRAHGTEDHAGKADPILKEQEDRGVAGDALAVRRAIEVGMDDTIAG